MGHNRDSHLFAAHRKWVLTAFREDRTFIFEIVGVIHCMYDYPSSGSGPGGSHFHTNFVSLLFLIYREARYRFAGHDEISELNCGEYLKSSDFRHFTTLEGRTLRESHAGPKQDDIVLHECISLMPSVFQVPRSHSNTPSAYCRIRL